MCMHCTGEEDDPGGHAVVLTGCAPNHLTFMNSWGQNWADGFFFRVKDKNVLHNMKFYDVYWTEDDLKPSEREAFKREGTERGKELLQQFPSVKELPYECPKCNKISKVQVTLLKQSVRNVTRNSSQLIKIFYRVFTVGPTTCR